MEEHDPQYKPHCLTWTQTGDSFHLVAGDIINERPIEIICTTITVPCQVESKLIVHGCRVDNQVYNEGTYIVPLAIKTLGPIVQPKIQIDIQKTDDPSILTSIQINTYWVYRSKDYIAKSLMIPSKFTDQYNYYCTPYIRTKKHGGNTRISPCGGPVSGVTITARNMQRCKVYLIPQQYNARQGKILIGDSAVCSDIDTHTQSVHFPMYSPIRCCDVEYLVIEPIAESGDSTIDAVYTHHVDYMTSECSQTYPKRGLAACTFAS